MKQIKEGFTPTPVADDMHDRMRASAPDGRIVGEGGIGHIENAPLSEQTAALEGTPLSNTVPSNYNPQTFKAFRYGVDSLYVSYKGVLAEAWGEKLATLKEVAQSESELEQSAAQIVICDHTFELRDKGRGRFAYVLVDNCYQIQVSHGKSTSLPMAYVQISSEYLSSVGIEQAEQALQYIVNTLGLVNEPPNISRVDLFVDFEAELRMDSFNPLEDWITRTQTLDLHYRYNQFSGWSFGMGGDIGARLYNKRLEIDKKSKKYYVLELWLAAGWNGDSQVWRMEFEAKREVLKQLGICKLDDLLSKQSSLWSYFTEDWLRLAVPNPNDTNQTRWVNHPLWDQITELFHQQAEQPKLSRFNPARLPTDERLFVHGLGGMTSFMASRGIEDIGEGIGEFVHQAKQFHTQRSGFKHDAMEKYINRKVKAKNRKYNTLKNQPVNMERANEQLAKEMDAYQCAKDGDDGDA